MAKPYKFYQQVDQMDCGPTCLRMIIAHYGKKINTQTIREHSRISRSGVSLYGISSAAESLGFHTRGAALDIESLKEAPKPCILHWDQNHFVVLYSYKNKHFYVADPAKTILKLNEREFRHHWSQGRDIGYALLLEPTPKFYEQENEGQDESGFHVFFSYLFRYKKLLMQLALGFLIGSLLQVLLPFLTQSIVDVAIPTQDLNFINLILIAQFSLLIGRASVDFIRSWILLHISTRLNFFVLTDFLTKLMKLPISFFDTKKTGDILQRIDDQRRIETFLTGQTLSVGFSIFSLIVFSVIMFLYDAKIFGVFALGTVFYASWIFAFLSKRKQLDFKRFDVASKNQSVTIQLIQGMQEIKLSGVERKKRWDWENLQAKLFHLNVKSLALGQYQQAGGIFFNEGKNLLIIFFVAKSVISGDLTLGSMIAIQYIIGQLNSPVEQFLSFVQSYQDAKLSLERLNELFNHKDEESYEDHFVYKLGKNRNIRFRDVTFCYPGGEPILQDFNLEIPEGKVTAIVGMSGSGKSTLIKLLLGFYKIQNGQLKIGETSIEKLSPSYWRQQCGVVMQDSFIFSDTIEANITLSEKDVDKERLDDAVRLACLDSFIDSLPIGLNTLIGSEGNGISQGQRQRILIARAIYKQPDLILLDEATNALDSNNERQIVTNLDNFFAGRTVVIVAHRLSTVRNAHKIVVLEEGKIAEEGTHKELTDLKGKYFELVKNQLELDS